MERFRVPPVKVETKKNTDNYERVEQYVESINFEILNDILKKLLEKSGSAVDRLEKVSTELIEVTKHKNLVSKIYHNYLVDSPVGTYSQKDDKVRLSSEKLSGRSEDFAEVVIFHEIIHAISDAFREEQDGVVKNRVGFHIARLDRRGLFIKWMRENRLLNEGVTQLVAEAVHDEYSRRVGEGSVTETSANIYAAGKKIVELLVRKISEKTGVVEEAVFFAVVRSMFNYDYDKFFELVKDDPELLELVENIKNTNSEMWLYKTDPNTGKTKVNLKKFTRAGAEQPIADAEAHEASFNPLVGKLI